MTNTPRVPEQKFDFENLVNRFKFFTAGLEKSNLDLKGEGGLPNKLPSYLNWDYKADGVFHNEHFLIELCTLNDSIQHNLNFEKIFFNNIKGLLESRPQYTNFQSIEDPKFDALYETDMDLEQNLTQAEFFLFAASANSLVTIYLWLIKTLNTWCIFAGNRKSLKEFKKINEESRPKRSEFEVLIRYLDQHLVKKHNQVSIEQKIKNDGFLDLINKNVRSIRNGYSHGDWGQIKKDIEKIQIVEVIRKVSHFIFYLSTSFESTRVLRF